MTHSKFERRPGDRYWTEPWVTNAFLRQFGGYLTEGTVWEPACGRGDMVRALSEHGLNVYASDVDMSDFPVSEAQDMCRIARDIDFLDIDTLLDPPEVQAIVTNPPYGKRAVEFVRRALDHDLALVAFLLRSEFNSAGKRTDLFERDDFAAEVVLTARPRWDDWRNKPKPDNAPRHNFSWFVWVKGWEGPNTQFWEGRT